MLYAKSLGSLGSEVVGYCNLGDCYLKKEDSSNAKKMFLKTYSYKDSILNLELMKVVCEKLSSLYEFENKDSALFFYKEYNFYKDSIKNFNVQKELKINQLKTDTLLLYHKLENEKKGIISERKQNSILFLSIAILVVFMVVIVVYVYKKIRKDNVALEDNLNAVSGEIKEKDLELNKFKKYIESPEASKQLLANLSTDKNWAKFMIDFELLYPNFFSSLNLKEGVSLTKNDYRIAALMHLKLSNKEFADILNITLSGVKNAKGRFKSKLQND